MGDGGGWESSSGEVRPEVSMDDGEIGDTAGSEDLAFLPDLEDLSVSESDLSPSPLDSRAEFRGLSVLLPGILDRRVLKDLADSLVSDLLKDGKDCSASGPPALVGLEALPSFDGWLPIALV